MVHRVLCGEVDAQRFFFLTAYLFPLHASGHGRMSQERSKIELKRERSDEFRLNCFEAKRRPASLAYPFSRRGVSSPWSAHSLTHVVPRRCQLISISPRHPRGATLRQSKHREVRGCQTLTMRTRQDGAEVDDITKMRPGSMSS